MTWDWQQIVALACVAGAAFLLCRRVLRLWKGSAEGGCGAGCQTCTVKDPASGAARKPLVTLDLRPPEARDTLSKR